MAEKLHPLLRLENPNKHLAQQKEILEKVVSIRKLMSQKIIVPTLGESVTEATVSKWLKNQGDKVISDEPVVELETDKVTLKCLHLRTAH